MIRITSAVLAVLATAGLAAAGPNGQDSGRHESPGTSSSPPHVRSSGLTMELMNGLPLTRDGWPYRVPAYQPYFYSGAYPNYSFNAAYSYPHPFGLGGYSPPRAGRYYHSSWYW